MKPALPFPGITGPSRRAHWRRHVLRRLVAAALVCAALLLVLLELRPLPAATTTVVIARHALPTGSVLGVDVLRAVSVPVAHAQPGSIGDPTEVEGRRIGSGLAAGEALTRTRLVARSTSDGLAPSRTVVHVVAADPAAVSLLHVGQRVVVFGPAGGPSLTRDAQVLATDPDTPADPFSSASTSGRGVVLALDSGDAEKVLTTADAMPGPPVVHVIGAG